MDLSQCLGALEAPGIGHNAQFLILSVETVIGRGCHEDKNSQKEGGEPGWTPLSVGERSESF